MLRVRIASLLLSLLILLLAGCESPPAPPGTTQPTGSTGSQATPTPSPTVTSTLRHLHLPPGFQVSVYASGLHAPRFITMGPNGVLLVADQGSGSIIAFPPGTSPLHAGAPIVVATHLNSPTSLVMHDGYLYVGEGSSIARMAVGSDLKAGSIQRIITGLPLGGQHWTRTVLIGPDNHIYVSIGSDCNVCIETNPHRAAIWVYNLDGSGGRLYAKGLRNAVGMAINPWTQQIWIDVNGRDYLGDNAPPETVYALVDQGDYGWPRCHAGRIHDPQFGQSPNACKGIQQPLVTMQAHSAPLGLAFYPIGVTQFPAQYRDSLYIAFHGSWNRSIPTGDKIVRIPLRNGQVAGPVQDFLTGWMTAGGTYRDRPVGITFAPDGSMFISSDKDGQIYHVWYNA
jgi:glucose/arabinose dehydrogenase